MLFPLAVVVWFNDDLNHDFFKFVHFRSVTFTIFNLRKVHTTLINCNLVECSFLKVRKNTNVFRSNFTN